MRLLNSRSMQLELLHSPPSYAIVSHRWGAESEEVLFADIGDQARSQNKAKGYRKIQGCCAQAVREGIEYVWLDTCCINKSDSTELGEAINSMYKWYSKSVVCYAYLHDVSDPNKFTESDWFTRGWTLQELIAPVFLKFFTKDWRFIGNREDLIGPIVERTGISSQILRSGGKIPPEIAISQKMSWTSDRRTTKLEDQAYSLLGILNVYMAPIYGIDDVAFETLQHQLVMKYPDQTLFAWYQSITAPEDVEMENTSSVTDPDLSTASVKGSTASSPFKPMVTTGLFALSPSQYLKSYEISESDFRNNYVDRIKDNSYTSHFFITNNVVRITLPVKHLKDKIWKAVLRCSFDSPDGDQIQRPLIIYLEQIEPWKYVRVHFLPERGGDEETSIVQGIPGSLEQLSDTESYLEGYVLRNVGVVCRHEESLFDGWKRPLPSDPDTFPDPTETERISRLPRHPPGVGTINIMVCGEPGVAAGRVINLIVGKVVIKPLTDYEREPMKVTIIDTTLHSKNFRIFYVIGPRDPYLDLEIYNTSVRHMHELVRLAKELGGIHLVLLCMVGSRVTPAVKSNYRLFHEYICDQRVPMMLVVTGLGRARRMEDWWDKHKNDPDILAMSIAKHACITVLQGEDEEHRMKYEMSVETIRKLLMAFATTSQNTYCPEDGNRWFANMGKRAMNLLLPSQKKSLSHEVIMKNLKELDLDEGEANDLVQQFFDEHAMELS